MLYKNIDRSFCSLYPPSPPPLPSPLLLLLILLLSPPPSFASFLSSSSSSSPPLRYPPSQPPPSSSPPSTPSSPPPPPYPPASSSSPLPKANLAQLYQYIHVQYLTWYFCLCIREPAPLFQFGGKGWLINVSRNQEIEKEGVDIFRARVRKKYKERLWRKSENEIERH